MFKYLFLVQILLISVSFGSSYTLSRKQWEIWNQKRVIWESGKFEGDIMLHPSQRNGIIEERYRWPNNEVPYELDSAFSDSEAAQIHEAVKNFAKNSCVTVRPRVASDQDYVYVTGDNTGCWSYVGRLGIGKQLLNLQRNGCIYDSTIVHEFLHAIGFHHQQCNWNRDDFVDIIWGNIQQGMEHNFDVYDKNTVNDYDQPYDYGSVMHYYETAFSSNGEPTIVPKDPAWVGWVGLATEMSEIDVVKLNAMYACHKT